MQEAFAEHSALQCGWCTPGSLMLAAGALADDPERDRDEERLTAVLASDLCRCTGCTSIRDAVCDAARRLRAADRATDPRRGG